MRWTKRMGLAIDYIEENLTNQIAIDDIAKQASSSKYHFHRVFFSYFNLTVSDYIRKRKFTLAAVDLVNGEMNIVDIALKYGYESPNAFTRAFRNIHGKNPSEVRSSQVKLTTYSRACIPLETRNIEKMEYKIVEVPAFNIVGKSKHFTFDDFAKQGPKFWKQYVGSDEYKKLCQLTNGRPGLISGAPLLTAYFPKENSKRDEFVDVFGVELTSGCDENSFELHSVPSASYAEFSCSYKNSMKTNRYIYGEWFSATGYERDGDKPDVVAYFSMPYRHFSEMAIQWWVPIVKNT